MIKIENLATPSPEWWNVAVNGMRNAYKSNEKSDSHFYEYDYSGEITTYFKDRRIYAFCDELTENDKNRLSNPEGKLISKNFYKEQFFLGESDEKLLLNLCKAGTSHRKVLRQLPVIMDITAPLYWWKQMDQYKLGTVTNSESTMHTMLKEPFKLSDFSLSDHWDHGCRVSAINHCETDDLELGDIYVAMSMKGFEHTTIRILNELRKAYEMTNDKSYWNKINELLPQSYNQKRTWSASYETLVNIIQQRRNHKLQEWTEFINYLLENVPYLKEIVNAIES